MARIGQFAIVSLLIGLTICSPSLAQQVLPPKSLANTADTLCIDLLSGARQVPSVEEEKNFFNHYGLQPGLPNEAIDALGHDGMGLISRATLASYQTPEFAFMVALGGYQQTCRIIVYRIDNTVAKEAELEKLLAKLGWKFAPGTSSSLATKRMFVKRDKQKRPFLLNILIPGDAITSKSPLALFLTVARIPDGVELPKGF